MTTQTYPGQKLDLLMRGMSPGDYRALREALESPEKWSAAQLTRVLRTEGYSIGVTTVKEWRTHHLGGVVR